MPNVDAVSLRLPSERDREYLLKQETTARRGEDLSTVALWNSARRLVQLDLTDVESSTKLAQSLHVTVQTLRNRARVARVISPEEQNDEVSFHVHLQLVLAIRGEDEHDELVKLLHSGDSHGLPWTIDTVREAIHEYWTDKGVAPKKGNGGRASGMVVGRNGVKVTGKRLSNGDIDLVLTKTRLRGTPTFYEEENDDGGVDTHIVVKPASRAIHKA